VSFRTPKDFWYLSVEAELETDLGFSRAHKSANFSDLSQAKYDIQKVGLGVFNLNRPLIHQLLHQEDMLSALGFRFGTHLRLR
jgi:hypothetical protein